MASKELGGVIVEGEAPGGFKAKISGLNSFTVRDLVVVAMLGILMYMVYSGEGDRAAFRATMYEYVAKAMQHDNTIMENQASIVKSIKDVTEEQRVMTYVLTLSESERKNLRLAMPQSLRERSR